MPSGQQTRTGPRGMLFFEVPYSSIKSILQNGLDKAYANSKAPDDPPIRHANIRGRGYYH